MSVLEESLKHKKGYMTVANGAGLITCSCGWRSEVSDDGKMFTGENLDIEKQWVKHLFEVVASLHVAELSRKAASMVADNVYASARWEIGLRNIVTILRGPYVEFEIPDIVEQVRQLKDERDKLRSHSDVVYNNAALCLDILEAAGMGSSGPNCLTDLAREIVAERDKLRRQVAELSKTLVDMAHPKDR